MSQNVGHPKLRKPMARITNIDTDFLLDIRHFLCGFLWDLKIGLVKGLVKLLRPFLCSSSLPESGGK